MIKEAIKTVFLIACSACCWYLAALRPEIEEPYSSIAIVTAILFTLAWIRHQLNRPSASSTSSET